MDIIYGIHSVEAAILNQAANIKEILFEEYDHSLRHKELYTLALESCIYVKQVSGIALNNLSKRQNHQGVIAILNSKRSNTSIDQLLANLKNNNNALILILDGITDPHNLGAIIRSADCFAIDAIILPKNNSANINNPIVHKTSSGAVNNLEVVSVNNISRTIRQLQSSQFWIAGTSLANTSISLYNFKPSNRMAWVMGNEGRGIRRLVSENCDYLVNIPTFGKTQSLNVSVAAGIILAYTRHCTVMTR